MITDFNCLKPPSIIDLIDGVNIKQIFYTYTISVKYLFT